MIRADADDRREPLLVPEVFPAGEGGIQAEGTVEGDDPGHVVGVFAADGDPGTVLVVEVFAVGDEHVERVCATAQVNADQDPTSSFAGSRQEERPQSGADAGGHAAVADFRNSRRFTGFDWLMSGASSLLLELG